MVLPAFFTTVPGATENISVWRQKQSGIVRAGAGIGVIVGPWGVDSARIPAIKWIMMCTVVELSAD